MCGRYSLSTSPELISSHFNLTSSQILIPRYNISPNNMVPIIKSWGTLDFANWGFVPKWMENRVDFKPLINAREETVLEKTMFKFSFLNSRCLVLADGYFEWTLIKRTKQPFYITKKDHAPFAFAGIISGETMTFLTRTSKKASIIYKFHDRMPTILSTEEQYKAWLNPKTKSADLGKMLSNISDQDYNIYPVSTFVNNVRNDNLSCIISLQ